MRFIFHISGTRKNNFQFKIITGIFFQTLIFPNSLKPGINVTSHVFGDLTKKIRYNKKRSGFLGDVLIRGGW